MQRQTVGCDEQVGYCYNGVTTVIQIGPLGVMDVWRQLKNKIHIREKPVFMNKLAWKFCRGIVTDRMSRHAHPRFCLVISMFVNFKFCNDFHSLLCRCGYSFHQGIYFTKRYEQYVFNSTEGKISTGKKCLKNYNIFFAALTISVPD